MVERGRGHARIYKPEIAAVMRTHESVLENARTSLTVSIVLNLIFLTALYVGFCERSEGCFTFDGV